MRFNCSEYDFGGLNTHLNETEKEIYDKEVILIKLNKTNLKTDNMLKWTATFLVIALIAGLLGFTGISEGAASIAKVIFFIFLVLLIGSLILGATIFKK